MTKMIFVNLPVGDVAASTAFYEAIGATKNPQFSQEGVASAMAFSDTIVFMILSHAHFSQFTDKPIADAHACAQVLLTMNEESREAVDAIVAKAAAAGGKPDPSPVQDYGFMYGRSFEDLDGHSFGPMWMDVEAAMKAMSAEAPAPAAA